MAQLSGRVDEQRCKISNLLSQLQNAEQRARILETGAGAARKRAEVNAKRVSERCIHQSREIGVRKRHQIIQFRFLSEAYSWVSCGHHRVE